MNKSLAKVSKNFIVKSNSLIEARYRLSLQESHVILWLLTQIKPEDEDFKVHKMNVTEFAKMLQLNTGNQYKELKNITKRLIQRVMEIYDPENQEFIQVSWLSSARYQQRKGNVLLRFDPSLRPYLLQLKTQFTKINITDLLGLRNIYSIRMFELLTQYEQFSKRRMSIEDIKLWCGVQPNEYRLYAHLKSKIINKTKAEINSKTEYEIDYTEIKESRKVVAIEWTIKKKDSNKKKVLEKVKVLQKEFRSETALIESLVEYGYGKTIAKRLVREKGEEVIKNALKAVNIQIERNHVRNPKAMLMTAIQENWHPEHYKPKTK